MKFIIAFILILSSPVMATSSDEIAKEHHQHLLDLAQSGDPDAQFFLGLKNYRSGQYFDAYHFLLKSAEQNQTNAQFLLCEMYFSGTFVKKNREVAFSWCYKAAQKKQLGALFLLGLMYKNGDGVDRDKEKGYRLITEAAARDHSDANFVLGLRYKAGDGVEKNDAIASTYIKKAASLGSVAAIEMLENK